MRAHALKPHFTAQAGVSNHAGRLPFAGWLHGNAAQREADEKDSSIYDFSTYAEGEEAVRLLIRNGFDPADLWLVGKGLPGDRHLLGSSGSGIDFVAAVATTLTRLFMYGPAQKTGPQTLMMHGNPLEAGKAHNVLVDHTNTLIEECLRFR
jgi:hypothetical protein